MRSSLPMGSDWEILLRPQGHDNTLLSADLGVWSRKAEATGLVS
jgi:hypothetical protein